MTTVHATTTSSSPTMTPVRVGLAISAFIGLANLPMTFVPIQTPDGQSGPPLAIMVLSAVLGVVSIVCAVVAWPSGNRIAIRINAAALLINILGALPAFFVDIQAWVQVLTAVAILLSIVALVLTLRRPRETYTVSD